jgi:HPt (histidine-containing phosphotransfer) domain-containing protein
VKRLKKGWALERGACDDLEWQERRVTGNKGNRASQRPAPLRRGGRLDLHHLRQSAGEDTLLAAELLNLFRVQAKVQLNLISLASLESDYRMALHTLKGAALAIGAKMIVEVIAQLDALPIADGSLRRQELISKLAEEIAATEAEIASLTA